MKSQFQLRSGRLCFHWLLPRHPGDFEPHSETPAEFQQFTSMTPYFTTATDVARKQASRASIDT